MSKEEISKETKNTLQNCWVMTTNHEGVNQMKTADEVILTPMYKGEVYKYHECSNCKKEIYFEEDIFQPFHFEENIKYCPFCGKEVIRYAKPKFIEEINWNWLDEYESIVEKMYRELEYIIYCKLDKEQIDELEEKSARGMEYFGQDRWSFPYSKGTICDIIHQITRTKVHYTEKRKLEKEFGGDLNERKNKKNNRKN